MNEPHPELQPGHPVEGPARARQRRPHLAMDDERTRAFLEQSPVGHVATVAGGQPFITPTSFWYDRETHAIYLHSARVGRLYSNVEDGTAACFECSTFGDYLPSNVALEFSVQYESVVAFGPIGRIPDPAAMRRALYGLLAKYFPELTAGSDFRPITDRELRRTAVYRIAVEELSGKRNWPAAADRDPDWRPGGDQSRSIP